MPVPCRHQNSGFYYVGNWEFRVESRDFGTTSGLASWLVGWVRLGELRPVEGGGFSRSVPETDAYFLFVL